MEIVDSARFQLFPELSAEEYDALKADIAERGVLVPIEIDQEGTLLDGFHRRRICDELGIEPPKTVRTFQSDDERTAHVIALNLRRRHLDPVTYGDFALRYGIVKATATLAENLTIPELAADLGVSVRTLERRIEAARLPEPYRTAVKEGRSTLAGVKKQLTKETRGHATPPPLPVGIYTTIVADPPWAYERGDIRGSAEGHYPVMTIEQVAALPIKELAADNAHLYLWVTNPHLPLVWPILAAWGFEYKTLLTWVKPVMGTGFYFRAATEHVVFAARGNLPLREQGIPNWFQADRQDHSTKPPVFYELVERASHGPYLELFARRPRPGWVVWGDEV